MPLLPGRLTGGAPSSPSPPPPPSPSSWSSSSLFDDDDDGISSSFSAATLVVRPLHPSDVLETTEALLAAFESDSDPPGRPQLERRLEREARRYAAVDPGPWLLHSVSLPPPRAPPRAATETTSLSPADFEGGEKTEEEEKKGIIEGEGNSPWWSSLPPSVSAAAANLGLPGSLRRQRAAELEALEEERAAAAWEEALEDAWGRWLWLVAEARSDDDGDGGSGGEGGGGKKRRRRRKIVGAAALLFHDRARSLRALERLASSDLCAAEENRRRWPRPEAASMDYCLWLRERFPASGWPPRGSRGSSPSSALIDPADADAAAGGSNFSSSSSEGVFGPCASLWWVGTLPEARGRGVGAALLDASAAVAAAAGFPRLFAQVEEWSCSSSGAEGKGGGEAVPRRSNNRGRRSGGLSGAPWLGSEEEASSSSSSPSSSSAASPVERMYRSAGFVEVPDPPQEGWGADERGGGGGGGRGGLSNRRSDGNGGGAVDRSAVLLQKEIW